MTIVASQEKYFSLRLDKESVFISTMLTLVVVMFILKLISISSSHAYEKLDKIIQHHYFSCIVSFLSSQDACYLFAFDYLVTTISHS